MTYSCHFIITLYKMDTEFRHHEHRNRGEHLSKKGQHIPAKTSFGHNHTGVRLYETLQGNYCLQRVTYIQK